MCGQDTDRILGADEDTTDTQTMLQLPALDMRTSITIRQDCSPIFIERVRIKSQLRITNLHRTDKMQILEDNF